MAEALSEGSGSEDRRYGILVVDDEEAILESLDFTLADEYRVYTARTGAEGLELIDHEDIDLVISDQVMPGMTGVEFFEQVIERKPFVIRMMLTGYADLQSLQRAINDGRIYRFISKPWEPEELRLGIRRALEANALLIENISLADRLKQANERLEAENVVLRREALDRYSFHNIIGSSPPMQRVFDVIEKVAETDATTLITGETGTGKDLVARAIHYAGARKDKPFVAQNCAALPDTLLESELFGHKRGSFTGAHADKKGLFELADGGTIFLDEVGETEPGMQVRLLRVLQDGEIRPLGSSSTIHVDVRVVAATNRDLAKEVEQGRFREDLYYRLRVVEIELPALRERRDDIPALAEHFLDRANERMNRGLEGFTVGAMDRLMAYEWKGNVRELENELERLTALAGDETVVGVDMLSELIRGARPQVVPSSDADAEIVEWDLNRAVDALKRHMLIRAIREAGSKTRGAERLGIPRQSLQKMLKRLEIGDEELAP